jgi:hypothetical protein
VVEMPSHVVADYEPVGSSATNVSAPAIASPWEVLATNGVLALAQSASEYGVYNQHSFLGTWPLTPEGYRYALQTYEAHEQSPAHGLTYATTGYQDPERLGLPTDPTLKSKTYSSPMSYIGSTRRILAWATKFGKRTPAFAVVGWLLAVSALLFMWSFLTIWYSVILFFGFVVIPYRLIRRSQRKNLHVQQTSLATQQAMLQQMAAQQQQIQAQQASMSPAAQGAPHGALLPSLPPPPPGVARAERPHP